MNYMSPHVGQKVARSWATSFPAWLPVLLILSCKHLNVYSVVNLNFGDYCKKRNPSFHRVEASEKNKKKYPLISFFLE